VGTVTSISSISQLLDFLNQTDRYPSLTATVTSFIMLSDTLGPHKHYAVLVNTPGPRLHRNLKCGRYTNVTLTSSTRLCTLNVSLSCSATPLFRQSPTSSAAFRPLLVPSTTPTQIPCGIG